MKYEVAAIAPNKCHVKLIAEDKIEKELLLIKDDEDASTKEYTFEVHYGRALRSKFGPKAHVSTVLPDDYPTEVFVEYIMEGGSIGGF